jgi:iron(III) transport system permease protein
MEVLNDYGLVKYFGVDTFTTGIFTAWFAFGNIEAALKLSAYLMIFVLALIMIERFQRRKIRYTTTSAGKRLIPVKARTGPGWLFLMFCLIPLVLGFVIPLIAFVYWSVSVYPIISFDFLTLLLNSFQLATIAALLVSLLTVFLAFVVRTYPFILPRLLIRTSTLGYAIPGAVVAIGILVAMICLDKQLNEGLGLLGKPLLTGSYFALIYAYIVRFMAVGYNSIDSGNARISGKLDQASRSLGVSKLRTMLFINMPLLKQSILAAALLVFIDVLKELPLTLIMRPFNFDTLAIRVFEYASDERIAEASPAALVIILTGVVPVYFLSALLKPKDQ